MSVLDISDEMNDITQKMFGKFFERLALNKEEFKLFSLINCLLATFVISFSFYSIYHMYMKMNRTTNSNKR